ncbi:protein disulfide isomerase-like 1-4 [Malus sylvestris]|uniref:protein disulfide isomerase-like 1-4 n=1 Tax=Malus sylvestris TaxID=3752 RepID=UPI0021AD2F20|nr:protein disulfide isomerase-like 1-4 [Malus sylvestris]
MTMRISASSRSPPTTATTRCTIQIRITTTRTITTISRTTPILTEGGDHDYSYKEPEVDEKDVAILKATNFNDMVEKNRFVMVEFYAPWCEHYQALKPEYSAAATELKGEYVILAKVDAIKENELSQEYGIEGFPTIFFFIDGVHKPYAGQRTKKGIVTWIKKKIGLGIQNVTTLEDAERILTAESKVVLAYLNSLVGLDSDELAAASRLEDEVSFYQNVDPKVAKLFHLDAEVKRPALVLLKNEAEKLSYFDMRIINRK